MYKIMLVDDEPDVLESMMRTIDWDAHGFDDPVGCCDGAEAAAQLAGGFHPQAVITDISMPTMDGLRLTELLRNDYPKALVVILSGHDDFAFAQRALKLGVYDYILKPVTPGGLRAMLGRMRQELDQRQLNDPEEMLRLGKEEFLERLLTGPVDTQVVEQNLRRYELTLTGSLAVAKLDVDLHTATAADLPLWRYALHNIGEEVAHAEDGVLALSGRENLLWLIVSSGGGRPEERALVLAHKIATLLHRHVEVTVSDGVGNAVEAPQALYLSAAQATAALEERFYNGEGSLAGGASPLAPRATALPDFAEFETAFGKAVNDYEEAAARRVLHEMFGEMRRLRLEQVQCVRYCQRLVSLLMHLAAKYMEGDKLKVLETAWEQYDLAAAMTMDSTEALVDRFCEQVFELLALVYDGSAASQVKKAENFIRQNHHNPRLSLQMVTDHLAVSTSYFSQIFKSETGSTFVEYLTAMRMEKARGILTTSAKRTYEVAYEVGYSDPHYFSSAFKRATGMSPREYREQYRRQGS